MTSQSLYSADYGHSSGCSRKKSKKDFKILVGVTASVATIKLGELVDSLLSKPSILEVAVVATDKSEKFYNAEEITGIGSKYGKPDVRIWRDEDEWSMWNGRGDPVLHIELGKWADAMILAPLDANTLAKISHGLCDNILTCTLRAWDLKNVQTKPVFFCPAMNTKMWEHPLTSEQIQQLEGFGYTQIPPIEKTLMCGDTGIGAMATIKTIVNTVESQLNQSSAAEGSSCERSGPSSGVMYNACDSSWCNPQCASSSENADITSNSWDYYSGQSQGCRGNQQRSDLCNGYFGYGGCGRGGMNNRQGQGRQAPMNMRQNDRTSEFIRYQNSQLGNCETREDNSKTRNFGYKRTDLTPTAGKNPPPSTLGSNGESCEDTEEYKQSQSQLPPVTNEPSSAFANEEELCEEDQQSQLPVGNPPGNGSRKNSAGRGSNASKLETASYQSSSNRNSVDGTSHLNSQHSKKSSEFQSRKTSENGSRKNSAGSRAGTGTTMGGSAGHENATASYQSTVHGDSRSGRNSAGSGAGTGTTKGGSVGHDNATASYQSTAHGDSRSGRNSAGSGVGADTTKEGSAAHANATGSYQSTVNNDTRSGRNSAGSTIGADTTKEGSAAHANATGSYQSTVNNDTRNGRNSTKSGAGAGTTKEGSATHANATGSYQSTVNNDTRSERNSAGSSIQNPRTASYTSITKNNNKNSLVGNSGTYVIDPKTDSSNRSSANTEPASKLLTDSSVLLEDSSKIGESSSARPSDDTNLEKKSEGGFSIINSIARSITSVSKNAPPPPAELATEESDVSMNEFANNVNYTSTRHNSVNAEDTSEESHIPASSVTEPSQANQSVSKMPPSTASMSSSKTKPGPSTKSYNSSKTKPSPSTKSYNSSKSKPGSKQTESGQPFTSIHQNDLTTEDSQVDQDFIAKFLEEDDGKELDDINQSTAFYDNSQSKHDSTVTTKAEDRSSEMDPGTSSATDNSVAIDPDDSEAVQKEIQKHLDDDDVDENE